MSKENDFEWKKEWYEDGHLEPENGWYCMTVRTGEGSFEIGVLFHEGKGSWGYWNYDRETQQKRWVEVDVPEKDKTLVRRAQPYTAEEQAMIDRLNEGVMRQFDEINRLFGFTDPFHED